MNSMLKGIFSSKLIIISIMIPAYSLAQGPPFGGTIFLDPDIITSSDISTFQGATFSGRGSRTMFDRRVNDWITVDAFLFDAVFDDGYTFEIQVNPEFGSSDSALAEALKYGEALGRMPSLLLKDVRKVWIHRGTKPFGGGGDNILIHTGMSALYESSGILEETLVHEATHTSLDVYHRSTAGWKAAQTNDGEFISTYARDFPTREDIAESFLTYLAIRYRPDRISRSLNETIIQTIPNRISYFDNQSFDMYPISEVMNASVNPKFIVPNLEEVFISANYSASGDSASVSANIIGFDGTLNDSVTLFDDGTNGDRMNGDNVWSGTWTPGAGESEYIVNVRALNDSLAANDNYYNVDRFTTIGPVSVESISVRLRTESTLVFKATFKNDGLLTKAKDIQSEIFSSDSCVTRIRIGKATIGEILAGDKVSASRDYVVDLNPNCANHENLFFRFDISSQGTFYWSDSSIFNFAVGLESERDGIPENYILEQNYPNPFNPVTTIRYSLPLSDDVSLIVYNLIGKDVAHLVNERKPAGIYTVEWDASNVTSGIYLYRLQVGDFVQTRKLILLK